MITKQLQFGIIGFPLTHSFSRKYFTEKFMEESINATYSNFEIEDVASLKDILHKNSNLVGLNVTIPHKQNVIPLLSEISDEAKAIGAVNVIKVSRDKDNNFALKGYNSDVYGFVESIRPLLNPEKHKKALVLGTGGASKAIVHGLNKLGISTQIVSRVGNKTSITYQDLDAQIMDECKIIVNCTPLGTYPKVDNAVDIPYEYLTPEHLLYDLVYNPEETLFLKKGKEKGANIKNGAEMLEKQAIKAWEIWNN